MSQIDPGILAALVIAGALGLFLAAMAAHFRRLRRRAERYEERVAEPRFGELERHFARSVPDGLKRLYDDRERVEGAGYFLQPADLETIEDAESEVGPGNFAFAYDMDGDLFYVPLERGSTAEDVPVFVRRDEDGATERVAGLIEEFHAALGRSLSEMESTS